MKKIGLIALVSLFLTLPAFAMTYKTSYSIPCSQVWVAVKDTLNVPDNYTVVSTDDTQMTSSYNVKHSAHVNISGTVLQRTNKVTLVTKGSGCEMQVVSNYSGWEHNDKGDFKKRVDESLAKLNASKPAEAVKPSDAK
jgi:exopolysaccharide biosynthesis protein